MRAVLVGPASRRAGVALLALALLVVPLAAAHAAQPDRVVPDYSRREPPPPTAGEVLLWVPRVVLYPVYLVTEYVIRWPLGAFLTSVERERVVAKVLSVVTFGTGGRTGLVPTFLVDFGFRPSVGLYFWATNLYGPRDSLGVHVAWGGARWWRLSVRQRFQFGGEWFAPLGMDDPERPEVPMSGYQTGSRRPDRELRLHFLLAYRPDFLFYGFGPEAPSLPTRFERRQWGGSVTYTEQFLTHSALSVRLEASRHDLRDGDPDRSDGEVAIGEAFDVTDPAVVPGFAGYTLGLASLELRLDSRAPRPHPGSGVRLAGRAELGTDLAADDVAFLRYGGELDFFLDLTGRQQVLVLRQWIGLIEELRDAPVPMPEQYVVGGGPETLRGLLEGRYRGLSGTVTTLSYSYPIWVFLDGYLFAEVGNAWGPRLEGFDVAKLAGSFGLGFRGGTERDNVFNFLLGVGTTRFDATRFGIESFRVIFGTSTGF
jgi:hypothetical protein